MIPAEDTILREPREYSRNNYDLIVVGGGIYGIMLSLEAARHNLKCLLLEKDDFCSHTSTNHLRILHGGLRYLQSLDIKRFRDSVAERSWFLSKFPELTEPIRCLMPLSGDGLFKPPVFSIAFVLDAIMAWNQNRMPPKHNQIKKGRVCSVEEVQKLVPYLSLGLAGGAIWHDGFTPDPIRLQIELLRWSCAFGTHALNYCPAETLIVEHGCVKGVKAIDRTNGREYSFSAPLVINATGPWCRQVARMWDRDIPELFPNRILVWNILFNRPALSEVAVAATAPNFKHTYFVVPWHEKMLVGTGHALLEKDTHIPPTHSQLAEMLTHLNDALPGINLEIKEILKTYWGVMPGSANCQLGKRPIIFAHSENGGPAGLVSVSGVKFTTARSVAEDTIQQFFQNRTAINYKKFKPVHAAGDRWSDLTKENTLARWEQLIKEESVTSIADAILRRSDRLVAMDWNENMLARLAPLIYGDTMKQRREIERTMNEYENMHKI